MPSYDLSNCNMRKIRKIFLKFLVMDCSKITVCLRVDVKRFDSHKKNNLMGINQKYQKIRDGRNMTQINIF